MVEKTVKLRVANAAARRTEEKSIRIVGIPTPVWVPGMLADFGYVGELASSLKVLMGRFDGKSFYGRGANQHILIMDCWTNCNGYLGKHDEDQHRAIALNHGAIFFGSFANINRSWHMPNWGVDYIVMDLANLAEEQRSKLERDYARCRDLIGTNNKGHRPFSKKNQKKAELFRQATAAAVL